MGDLKFVADGDLSEPIRRGLLRREPSIDFLSKFEGGIVDLPDPEVLAIAADLGRVLVSHDRKTMIGHFYRFIESRSSPGLIIVSRKIPVGQAVRELHKLWMRSEERDLMNQVRYVPL